MTTEVTLIYILYNVNLNSCTDEIMEHSVAQNKTKIRNNKNALGISFSRKSALNYSTRENNSKV